MQMVHQAEGRYVDTGEEHPLPAEITNFNGTYFTTRADVVVHRLPITGLSAAGSAYAANDTFGELIPLPNMARDKGGTFAVTKVTFYDFDDEGLGKVMHLFSRPVTLAADNAAWSLSDADVRYYLGSVSLSVFQDHVNNQTCTVNPALYCKCDDLYTGIWVAFQTLGADDIANASRPMFEIMALRD